MSLKQRITADFMAAFKAKETEKKNFLGLIKSTIDNEEKSVKGYQGEITDESILKIIAKFEKNTNEVIKSATGETLVSANAQLEILKSYLPTKLTDAEIEAYYTRHNAISLINEIKDDQKKAVRWYIDCGDDDFLFEGNSLVHIAMRKKEIPHEFRIRDGAHSWSYWRTSLPTVLSFVSDAFHQYQ